MKISPILRFMKPGDAAVMAEIERECFADPWSEQALESECDNACAKYIVIEIAERIVAYAGMWVIVDEAHITNVATREPYRNQGLARSAMQMLMDCAKQNGAKAMTLEVRISNIAAQKLYVQMGFEIAGQRKGFYSDREDAIIMWKYEL